MSTKRKHLSDFLLTFFEDKEEYKNDRFVNQEKEVNGFILVKYFDKASYRFNVLIYTPESRARNVEYVSQGLFNKNIT